MGERHQGQTGDDVPGPGTYDRQFGLVHPRSPLGKINPYYDHPQVNNNPGPGWYNPEDQLTHQ